MNWRKDQAPIFSRLTGSRYCISAKAFTPPDTFCGVYKPDTLPMKPKIVLNRRA